METAAAGGGGGGVVLGSDGSFPGTQNGLFTASSSPSPSPLLALSSSSAAAAAADDEGAEAAAAAARRRKWCSVDDGRSGGVFDEQSGSGFSIDDWRASKAAKTGHPPPPPQQQPDFLNGGGGSGRKSTGGGGVPMKLTAAAAAADAGKGGEGVYTDSCFQLLQQQNMLSFSGCSKPEVVVTAPAYLPQMSAVAAAQSKSPGYHSGALNSASNLYLLNGIRGPFTPSQWLELEQQALIYKYITANQPIPSHLLIPIRKALESAGLYGFNCAQLKPSTWGWGPFHLGYSNSTDPEPGRCRRTDGKKWRCSRDAVQDQKYCERHMNRGRHRSRKLVEGQATGNVKNNDHSIQGTKLSSSTMKLATSSAAVVAGPDGSSSNVFDLTRNFQSTSHPLVNRMLGNSGPGLPDSATQISFLPPSSNLNSTNNLLSASRTHYPYNKESTPCQFGVPSNGSMFTSAATISHQNSFSGNYSSSSYEPAETRHSLHGIVNGWATTHAADHSSTFLWPGLHPKSETTDLSVSLPLGGPADFMSSTSSPINEKATLSPLRLSRELDRTQMSLGVGLETNDHSQQGQEKQTNWIPISWEASMGGPLGEVLQSTSGNTNNSSVGEYKKTSSSSSPLNLLPKGWEYGGGSQPSSSPTGVLQSAFVSLSNSSAGSSPRADNSKAIESVGGGTAGGGNSIYNDLIIGPTLCHSSSSAPALD